MQQRPCKLQTMDGIGAIILFSVAPIIRSVIKKTINWHNFCTSISDWNHDGKDSRYIYLLQLANQIVLSLHIYFCSQISILGANTLNCLQVLWIHTQEGYSWKTTPFIVCGPSSWSASSATANHHLHSYKMDTTTTPYSTLNSA